MTDKIFQLINLGHDTPVVLTVLCDGAPTIALAGEVSSRDCGTETQGGTTSRIDLSVEAGEWFLSVYPKPGSKITVRGFKPVFGDVLPEEKE